MARKLLELYNIAERDGIGVYLFPLETAESLSIQDESGACAVAVDPEKLRGLADEKVKLAHELGHCETGSFYNRFAALDIRQKHENRADKWAIRRAVPAEELEAAVAAGHIELWDLAELFGVTEEFMRKAICLHKHGNSAVDSYM